MKLFQVGLICLIVVLMVMPSWIQASDPIYEALEQGDCAKAKEIFEKDMKPQAQGFLKDAPYLNFVSAVSIKGQCYDLGIAICSEWIDITTVKQVPYSYRGDFYQEKGAYDKAIADYAKSLEADSSYTSSLQQLAWLLATCPEASYRDGHKAVEYAKKLIELAEEEKAYNFETLAAAYAENENFADAITAQEKAISLLQGDNEKTRAKYEKQLLSYKEGKPWRMEPVE